MSRHGSRLVERILHATLFGVGGGVALVYCVLTLAGGLRAAFGSAPADPDWIGRVIVTAPSGLFASVCMWAARDALRGGEHE